MAGSAYLYGLAQANLEINAVFGILMAAFVFVPLYLKLRVVTITQFFEKKFGPQGGHGLLGADDGALRLPLPGHDPVLGRLRGQRPVSRADRVPGTRTRPCAS